MSSLSVNGCLQSTTCMTEETPLSTQILWKTYTNIRYHIYFATLIQEKAVLKADPLTNLTHTFSTPCTLSINIKGLAGKQQLGLWYEQIFIYILICNKRWQK